MITLLVFALLMKLSEIPGQHQIELTNELFMLFVINDGVWLNLFKKGD